MQRFQKEGDKRFIRRANFNPLYASLRVSMAFLRDCRYRQPCRLSTLRIVHVEVVAGIPASVLSLFAVKDPMEILKRCTARIMCTAPISDSETEIQVKNYSYFQGIRSEWTKRQFYLNFHGIQESPLAHWQWRNLHHLPYSATFVISLFDTTVLNLYNIYYTRLLFYLSLIKAKVFRIYESEAKNPLVAFYDTPGNCWGYSYKPPPTGLVIFFYVKAYVQSLYNKICRKIKSAKTSRKSEKS